MLSFVHKFRQLGRRIDGLGVALLVDQEAHQQRINCHIEDRHEDEGNGEWAYSDQDEHVDGLLDVGLDAGHEGDEQVEQKGSEDCDCYFADDGQDVAYYSYHAVPHGVAGDQRHGVRGSSTEIFAGYCDHYVGVFVQKLHDLLEAVKAAAYAAGDILKAGGLVAALWFQRFHDYFKYELDELNDGDDKRSEGKTAEVASEGHVEARANWGIKVHARSVREVPNCACGSNHEDGDSHEQSVDPKSTEDQVVEVAQATAGVALNAGEHVSAIDNEVSRRD